MKIVKGYEMIEGGIRVFMGEGTLEDEVADQFKEGAIIDQTRTIPGTLEVGSSTPITNAIVTTKKYRVLTVQERQSETGTPILDVTMKETTDTV